jgi:hypothetical protein
MAASVNDYPAQAIVRARQRACGTNNSSGVRGARSGRCAGALWGVADGQLVSLPGGPLANQVLLVHARLRIELRPCLWLLGVVSGDVGRLEATGIRGCSHGAWGMTERWLVFDGPPEAASKEIEGAAGPYLIGRRSMSSGVA